MFQNQKIFNQACIMDLIFGGHMSKNQSRCMCKSNIVVKDHKELEGEIKIHAYGSNSKATNWSRQKGACA